MHSTHSSPKIAFESSLLLSFLILKQPRGFFQVIVGDIDHPILHGRILLEDRNGITASCHDPHLFGRELNTAVLANQFIALRLIVSLAGSIAALTGVKGRPDLSSRIFNGNDLHFCSGHLKGIELRYPVDFTYRDGVKW